jgi:catechol 2,3-dioxygenase-like lactoylglutathione lyase family enzyme
MPIHHLKLDHCVISVSDRRRSDEFYRDVLGAVIVCPTDEMTQEQLAVLDSQTRRTALNFRFYRFDTTQLNVHGPDLNIEANLLAGVPVSPGGSDLCFEWPGPIEDAAAHLRRCGVAIEMGPRPAGGRLGPGISVYFRDPDGSLLEFISYCSPRS